MVLKRLKIIPNTFLLTNSMQNDLKVQVSNNFFTKYCFLENIKLGGATAFFCCPYALASYCLMWKLVAHTVAKATLLITENIHSLTLQSMGRTNKPETLTIASNFVNQQFIQLETALVFLRLLSENFTRFYFSK